MGGSCGAAACSETHSCGIRLLPSMGPPRSVEVGPSCGPLCAFLALPLGGCSKAPLSDNLEVVTAPTLLEPEEALVARKLSTVYEQQQRSLSLPASALSRPSGAPRPGGRRPASAASRRSVEESVEGSEGARAQLMEEGVVDSAALQEGGMPAAAAAAAGLPGAPPAAAGAAAGGAAEAQPAAAAGAEAAVTAPAPSLMHDIVADWGVGMRDWSAVMRASVGVYQVRLCVVAWIVYCSDGSVCWQQRQALDGGCCCAASLAPARRVPA